MATGRVPRASVAESSSVIANQFSRIIEKALLRTAAATCEERAIVYDRATSALLEHLSRIGIAADSHEGVAQRQLLQAAIVATESRHTVAGEAAATILSPVSDTKPQTVAPTRQPSAAAELFEPTPLAPAATDPQRECEPQPEPEPEEAPKPGPIPAPAHEVADEPEPELIPGSESPSLPEVKVEQAPESAPPPPVGSPEPEPTPPPSLVQAAALPLAPEAKVEPQSVAPTFEVEVAQEPTAVAPEVDPTPPPPEVELTPEPAPAPPDPEPISVQETESSPVPDVEPTPPAEAAEAEAPETVGLATLAEPAFDDSDLVEDLGRNDPHGDEPDEQTVRSSVIVLAISLAVVVLLLWSGFVDGPLRLLRGGGLPGSALPVLESPKDLDAPKGLGTGAWWKRYLTGEGSGGPNVVAFTVGPGGRPGDIVEGSMVWRPSLGSSGDDARVLFIGHLDVPGLGLVADISVERAREADLERTNVIVMQVKKSSGQILQYGFPKPLGVADSVNVAGEGMTIPVGLDHVIFGFPGSAAKTATALATLAAAEALEFMLIYEDGERRIVVVPWPQEVRRVFIP